MKQGSCVLSWRSRADLFTLVSSHSHLEAAAGNNGCRIPFLLPFLLRERVGGKIRHSIVGKVGLRRRINLPFQLEETFKGIFPVKGQGGRWPTRTQGLAEVSPFPEDTCPPASWSSFPFVPRSGTVTTEGNGIKIPLVISGIRVSHML